jgi:Flp pilus assembly protein TadG
VRAPRRLCFCPGDRGLADNEEGSALIEMAVSFSVLFLMLFCFMEICMAFYTQHMISEAARGGARYAMVHGSACITSAGSSCTLTGANINTYVNGLVSPNIAGGTFTATTTYPSGNENVGSQVKVQIAYTFKVTMPLVPKDTFNLTSSSEVPILR